MNYRLKVTGGKVKYLNRYNGEVVGSDTPLDSATWLLSRNEPEKSDEFKGFPIKVSANNSEYFLAGEWLMGGAKDVLGEDAPESAGKAPCGPDSCEVDAMEVYSHKGADKPQKRRRTKDVVCE